MASAPAFPSREVRLAEMDSLGSTEAGPCRITPDIRHHVRELLFDFPYLVMSVIRYLYLMESQNRYFKL